MESKWRWNWWQTGWYFGEPRLAARLLDGSGYYITNLRTFTGFPILYKPDVTDPNGMPYLEPNVDYPADQSLPFPFGYEVEPDNTPIP